MPMATKLPIVYIKNIISTQKAYVISCVIDQNLFYFNQMPKIKTKQKKKTKKASAPPKESVSGHSYVYVHNNNNNY